MRRPRKVNSSGATGHLIGHAGDVHHQPGVVEGLQCLAQRLVCLEV
jgi:hypothetical protein